MNMEISHPTKESIEELVSQEPNSFVKSYTPKEHNYSKILLDMERSIDEKKHKQNKASSTYVTTWVKPAYVKTWTKENYKKTWAEEYPIDYLDMVNESFILQKLEKRGIRNIARIKRDAQGNALSASGFNGKTRKFHTSIAIEEIEGVTMDGYSFKNQQEIVTTFIKVARTMNEINKEGILYNDIKPRNIMMNKEGEPIIIDFDSCGYLKENGVEVIKGTPAYDSPEKKTYMLYPHLFTKSPIGIQSDIYSFALTLADIVGLDIQELNQSQVDAFIRDNKIDEKLGNFIKINISSAPKDRMQTFEEVEKYLSSINEKAVQSY